MLRARAEPSFGGPVDKLVHKTACSRERESSTSMQQGLDSCGCLSPRPATPQAAWVTGCPARRSQRVRSRRWRRSAAPTRATSRRTAAKPCARAWTWPGGRSWLAHQYATAAWSWAPCGCAPGGFEWVAGPGTCPGGRSQPMRPCTTAAWSWAPCGPGLVDEALGLREAGDACRRGLLAGKSALKSLPQPTYSP